VAPFDAAAYVAAACAAQELDFGPEELERIRVQLERMAAIAGPLMDATLEAHDEPAPVSRA
jgi:hypothetical protein